MATENKKGLASLFLSQSAGRPVGRSVSQQVPPSSTVFIFDRNTSFLSTKIWQSGIGNKQNSLFYSLFTVICLKSFFLCLVKRFRSEVDNSLCHSLKVSLPLYNTGYKEKSSKNFDLSCLFHSFWRFIWDMLYQHSVIQKQMSRRISEERWSSCSPL